MLIEEFGGWKLFIGKKFSAFVRSYRSNIEIRNKLDKMIRATGYRTPIFLRELRTGEFMYDYFDKGKIKRAMFDKNLNKISEEEILIHPEYEGISDEETFFGQLSITEPFYRNYYVMKYFNKKLDVQPINMFVARISGDKIEGLMTYHGYTAPFIEYVLKIDRHIVVSDKPLKDVKIVDIDLPEPFEYHIIDETNYRKTMLFAHVNNIEIMYPEGTSLDDTIKVPTITEGVLRLIPVKANDPEKIIQRVSKIESNPQKIYIYRDKTIIISETGKKIVLHTHPPTVAFPT